MNPAGNAVKFTVAGGVGLRVMKRGEMLAIVIEDTGPGIPASRLEAIFEEFEQADTHTANRHGGSGLGLVISRRLARLMGGDIEVESRVGLGSTFTLTLPLGEAGYIAPSGVHAYDRKVLIVGAGPFEGRYLRDYFKASGSKVKTVSNNETALAAIRAQTPDLLIMDAAFGPEEARRVVSASSGAGFFKATKYADELLHFEGIDWPDFIKVSQTNWIGRSEGASVIFKTEAGDPIEIFTIRPDTLWGATFMVFSPEHPLVDKITAPENKAAIDEYKAQAAKQTDIQRESKDKEKTGGFTGGYAINPVNQERIPIWVADYVLMSYGTGAIMAVPAHDERDVAVRAQVWLESDSRHSA